MEIYAYGNVAAIQGVLHALIMIFGAADFADAVRVAIVIGFMVAACAAMFQMTYRGWMWLITVMVLYSMLFVPKMTVSIIDKLGLKPPVVIDSVPWAAGALFAIKSQLGHTMTNMFETALQTIPDPEFALPSELSFQQHGVMFGARLIRDARLASIEDPLLRADLINFIRNCVFPELSGNGLIDAADFSSSKNLWPLMANVNPVLTTTYTPPGESMTVKSCKEVYGLINDRLIAGDGELSKMLKRYANWLMPGVNVAVSQPLIAAAMPAAFVKSQLSDGSEDASELLLQNAMINHVIETGQVIGLSTNDPAAVLMSQARAQANAQMNATYAQQASMADLAMPITRNVVEAFLMGVFPVICLMSFALEGKTLKMLWTGYLFALVWIELWPIVYAIINYVGTTYASFDMAAAGNPSNGVSLDTAALVYSATLRPSSVVGSMITFVPMLAAALLWGFGRVAGAVPSMRELFSPGASAVTEAARGSSSQGLMEFDKRSLTPQTTSAYADRRQRDSDGITTTSFGDGSRVIEVPQNNVPLHLRQEMSRAVGLTREAAQSETAARQEGVAAETATMGAFAQVVIKSDSRGTSQAVGGGVDKSVAKEDRETLQRVQSLAHDWKEEFKLGDREAAQAALGAILGKQFPKALAAGLSGRIDASTVANFERAYDEVRRAATQEQVARAQSLQERLATNQQYRDGLLSTQQDRDDVSARYEEASRHTSSQRAHLDKARSLREQATETMNSAIAAGVNIEKDPAFASFLMQVLPRAREHSGNPMQRAIFVETELARYVQSWSEMNRMPERFSSGAPVRTAPAAEYERMANEVKDGSGAAFEAAKSRLGPVNTAPVSRPDWALTTDELVHRFNQETAADRERIAAEAQQRQERVERELDLDKDGMTQQSMAGRVGQNVMANVGIPRTNPEECKSALADGRMLDASLACPAPDFVGGAVDKLTGGKPASDAGNKGEEKQ